MNDDYEDLRIKLTDDDYVLADGRAWFTAGDKSIRIVMNDEGVLNVFVFPVGEEMNEPIADLTV